MLEQKLLHRLLRVIVQGQGAATAAQMQAAGIDEQDLHRLVGEQVLMEEPPHRFTLADPLVDIDVLVFAHWAVPQGVFGGLTALVSHHLSVAQLVALDIYLPASSAAPVAVAGIPLHPRMLSPELWSFGVTSLMPALPGEVAVPVYTPAVAVAQVLSATDIALEDCQDTVLTYLAYFGRDPALHEAISQYHLTMQLVDQVIAAA